MRKAVYFWAITIAVLALVLIPLRGLAQTLSSGCEDLELVSSFEPWGPSEYPNDSLHGIAALNENEIWVGKRVGPESFSPSDQIHVFNASGETQMIYDAPCPPGSISGLAWVKVKGEEPSLWLTNDSNREICRLEIENGELVATQCFNFDSIRFEAGCVDSTGLAYCKGHFWNAAFNWDDPENSCIYKIKVEEVEGALSVTDVKTLHAPGTGPTGLDCDNAFIWHVDTTWGEPVNGSYEWVGNRIYKLNPGGMVLCSWDGPGSGFGALLGVTFDGTYYWVSEMRWLHKLRKVP